MSNTPEELSIALHNASSTKFNTEEIINDIYELNDQNFVAGNWFSRRLASVSKTFGDAASYLDNARISYEEDLDLVFEKTIRENRAVWELLHPSGEEEPLYYSDWFGEKSSILPKFKRKFGQIPSSEYTSSSKGRSKDGDLELENIYIYFYSLFDDQSSIDTKLELTVEYSNSEKGHIRIEKYDKMTVLDQSFKIKYAQNVNFITFVVYEADKKFGSIELDLNSFKPDQIFKLWVDVVNEKDNENDLEFEIGVLCEGQQRAGNYESIINHSLKRKAPERVDILNEDNINSFVKKTKAEILRQTIFEKEVLEEYYTDDQIRLILNTKYNFVITKENMEMGRIEFDDLIEFCSEVLFSRWENELDEVFAEFTTTTKQALDNKSAETTNILDKAAVMLLCKTMARRNHQLYGLPNQDIDFVFSIKNFMVTLILMSSITLGQKLDLIYEIFDWEDGEGDGLDQKTLKLLCNTVLNRNLQFVPSNQVDNMVDLLYGGEAGCITSVTYSSYVPSKDAPLSFKHLLELVKRNKEGDSRGRYERENEFVDSVDLTKPFQDILWKYHNIFGCKSFCFHPDFSPFHDLQSMIKLSKYDIYLPKKKGVENVLCIVYQTNGIKRVYTAYYDGNHRLLRVDDDPDVESQQLDGAEKILQQNKYFCDMENYPTSVSKQQFIFTSIHVPYLSDFMRSETMIRCEDYEIALKDRAELLDNVLQIHLLNKKGSPMLTCRFNKNVDDIEFDPSLTSYLTDNNRIHKFVGIKKGVVVIKLSGAYKSNSLVDIATRIDMAIKIIKAEINTDNAEIENLDLNKFTWGFKKLGDNGRNPLSNDQDLEEITYQQGYELAYFPIQNKTIIERRPKPIVKMFDDKYDCYCLLEEIDQTKQWVPCFIKGKIGKEYIVELRNREGFEIRKSRENLLFSKERMHHFEPELF